MDRTKPNRRMVLAAIVAIPAMGLPTALPCLELSEQERIFAQWRERHGNKEAEQMIALIHGGCHKCGATLVIGQAAIIKYRSQQVMYAACDSCESYSYQA